MKTTHLPRQEKFSEMNGAHSVPKIIEFLFIYFIIISRCEIINFGLCYHSIISKGNGFAVSNWVVYNMDSAGESRCPRVVLVFSGKRKSGKDYITDILQKKYNYCIRMEFTVLNFSAV